MDEPISTAAARALIRKILHSGDVRFTGHALQELQKDGLSTVDAINALRGGVVEPAERENEQWRYRVRTGRIAVVIAFRGGDRLVVITAWRNS